MTFDRGETDVMHFPFFVMQHLKRATAENINGVILPKFRWLAIVNLSDSQSFEIIFCQNA